jgi:hypothetical protein
VFMRAAPCYAARVLVHPPSHAASLNHRSALDANHADSRTIRSALDAVVVQVIHCPSCCVAHRLLMSPIDSCLAWNVRGLNARARRNVVREFVVQERPTLVCILETKLEPTLACILETKFSNICNALAFPDPLLPAAAWRLCRTPACTIVLGRVGVIGPRAPSALASGQAAGRPPLLPAAPWRLCPTPACAILGCVGVRFVVVGYCSECFATCFATTAFPWRRLFRVVDLFSYRCFAVESDLALPLLRILCRSSVGRY